MTETSNREGEFIRYHRLKHLEEILNQFQAKEPIDISDEVYDMIILELERSRVSNLQISSITEMKGILKRLKLQSYYEYIPQIIGKITGKYPFTLSKETEEKLK